MTTAANKTFLGMNRQQGALIGTLSLVLVGVLYFGQGSSETAPDVTAADSARPSASRRAMPAQAAATVTKWPSVSLEQMLQNNPFAARRELSVTASTDANAAPKTPAESVSETSTASTTEPDSAPNELRQRAEAFLDELRTQRVKMILRSGKNVSAMIGERLIREGDVIDGVRIVSILPNAVLAELTQAD